MAAAAWLLWILLLPTHPWSKHVSNVGLTVMPLVAAWQCAVRGRGLTGRLRRGWLLMGGSCLAWGLGMVVWSAYESIGGREVPFPSLADVGYLATVPLAVAALLIFPTAPQRTAAQIRTVVDGLVIGASILIVSWILALGPVVR
ncbi:MAG TPA: diguanylate cyclase, partial [Acidimicrobiia bacterium]|nr:diguanylate cyclase [Acidimicrobiia bacterium]